MNKEEKNAIGIFTGMVTCHGDESDKEHWEIILNLIQKQETLINTMQAEFERLENLEDNTIDIQSIEQLSENIDEFGWAEVGEIINELVQGLKQLDKQISTRFKTTRQTN